MADPVAWLLIEPGWKVVTADGDEAGRVETVTGDANADIFDGLTIAFSSLSRPRYVPAEQVAEITEGTVHLALDRAGVDALAEYAEPAKASFVGGAETEMMAADPREHHVGVVRRLLSYLGLAGRR